MLEIWNEDRITELKKLFSEGYSAGNIGTAMGLSRNSVIGKLFRLKLKRDTPPRIKKVRMPRAPKTRSGEHHAVRKIVAGGNGSLRVIRSIEAAERYELRCVEIIPLNLTFEELQPNSCRYIYGDTPAEFVYCGHPKDTSSYCPGHHALCWQESRPPRNQAWRAAA